MHIKRITEEPEPSPSQIIRVVKENPQPGELTWMDREMNADSIVKLNINSEGAVDTIFINMDSNLVKNWLMKKG